MFMLPHRACVHVGTSLGLLFSAGVALASVEAARAQSITAADDGTGSVVRQTGDRYTIEAGSLSDNGANLFHSFEQFSVQSQETASFLTNPAVQTIFARVNGGALSTIDGQLQILGDGASSPNLFFMNPAGVLFGAQARLNLPGNFTVTTADAIGITRDDLAPGWFSATGANAYAALTGGPTGAFAFLSAQPGSVVNAGSLVLEPNAALTLLGGRVINTGTLSAPGGRLTLAAIPGEQWVRLSQPGSLLSLELTTLTPQSFVSSGLTTPSVTPLSLPALLTQAGPSHATQLTPQADGSVRLMTAAGRSVILGAGPETRADAIATGVLTADALTSEAGTAGEIAVLGDRVLLTGAEVSAQGLQGGGTLRLGGDYRGQGPLATARQTYVDADTRLRADAVQAGDGGRIILWADDTTQFAGLISATGGAQAGNGGFVEVSGKSALVFRGQVDTSASQGAAGTLLLDPENITITDGGNGVDDEQILDFAIFEGEPGALYTLSEEALESLAGNATVTLEARDDIQIEDLSDNGLSFAPGAGSIIFRADTDGDGIGDITMEDPNDGIFAPGRSLDFVGVNLFLGKLETAAVAGGEIVLEADDVVSVEDIITTSSVGNGGDVAIAAGGDILTEAIITEGQLSGGDIDLSSDTGDIDTGALLTAGGSGAQGIESLSAPQGDIFVDGAFRSSAAIDDEEEYFFEEEDSLYEEGDTFEEDDFSVDDDLLDAEEFEDDLDGGDTDYDEFEEASDSDEFEDSDSDSEFDHDSDLEDDSDSDSDSDSDADLDSDSEEGSDESSDDDSDDSDADDSDSDEETGDWDEFEIYDWQLDQLDSTEAGEEIQKAEKESSQDFSEYLGRDLGGTELTSEQVQQLLADIEANTQNRSAIVYIQTPRPAEANPTGVADSSPAKQIEPSSLAPSKDSLPTSEALEILVFSANQAPIKITASGLNNELLLESVNQFRTSLVTSARRGGTGYLEPAQRLHQWLIAPVEAALGDQAIDTLVFAMGPGLRSLPVAALHDGEQFLVEKYSLGVVPALSLIDTQYEPLAEAEVLAMGVSDFQTLAPLPAVPYEVDLINQLWPGSSFLNETFTRENLVEQRQQSPYRVIHMATHAEFKPGSADNSYIQLWDEQLLLSELDRLGWEYPAVDLLVLSACSTAVGSQEAEMGFAGLAVASGVRSAMASLWSVNDVGTLALMGEFYSQLKNKTVKVDALRSAQLAMLSGMLQTESGDIALGNEVALPDNLRTSSNIDLSHPYYWSGFTMIGSPW